MYESVDVVGFSPSPSSPSSGSFLSMDYYHRPPGLGAEKGLLSGVGGLQRSFGGSLVTSRHWSGSSHCEFYEKEIILYSCCEKERRDTTEAVSESVIYMIELKNKSILPRYVTIKMLFHVALLDVSLLITFY